MANWYGITYFWGFLVWRQESLFLKLWKNIMCPHGWHLFDECWGAGEENDELVSPVPSAVHSLYCDACDLDVVIKSVYKWNDKTRTNDYLGN